jgi:hypothetical protein
LLHPTSKHLRVAAWLHCNLRREKTQVTVYNEVVETVTHVKNDERSTVARRESRDGLQDAVFRPGSLRRIPSQEVILRLGTGQLANRG